MTTTTYKITRFRFVGGNTTIKRGLTLAEAREHCNRDDTKGDGWFDGYDVDVKGDEGEQCKHCGVTTFTDDEGVLRHDGHEGESCGEASPDTYAEVDDA